jgi:hypothetical protein
MDQPSTSKTREWQGPSQFQQPGITRICQCVRFTHCLPLYGTMYAYMQRCHSSILERSIEEPTMTTRSRQRLLALSSTVLLAACAMGSGMDDEGGGGSSSTSGDGGNTGTGGSSTSTSTSSTSTSGTSSTSSSSSTSGQGGDDTGGGGSASSSSSSSSSGTNNCAHDVCTTGLNLTMGCGDPCVDTVCLQDSFCCDIEWDLLCVDAAVQFCGANCGGGSPLPGDLVITEIMNNPSAVSDSAGEWFEIYNDTGSAIDLAGLVIVHQPNDPQATHTIAQSVMVPAGGFAVLGINANASTNGNVTVDYQYANTVNLNNTADYLAIETANQVVIDELSYDQVSGLDPDGKTRNLNPQYLTAFDNDTDLRFCEATTPISGGTDLGTPGVGNDNCN